MKTASDFQNCAERLRALADSERLKIILHLFDGEKNVGEIAALLNDEVVNVSHHLGVLRHARIVETERHGRFVNYRLHPDVVLNSDEEGSEHSIEFGCCRIDLTGAAGQRSR